MGLPLFVAPVESDLPSKATDKNSATSPSRSGIRRHARPDSRERRAAIRRHMSIRDRLATGSLRQSSSLSGSGRPSVAARLPGETTHFNEMLMEDPHSRPFREVLREMVRSDDQSRERFEEQLHSLFSGDSQQVRPVDNNNFREVAATIGWWAGDALAPVPRTRIQDGEDRPRPNQRELPLVPQPRASRPPLVTGSLSRRQRTESRIRASLSGFEGSEHQRNLIIQRMRGVDGLGDRDRSLSPEGWDTLLTTLTPDPQPPSAGSSFHSTVASQSAGVSSSTSLTGPELGEPGAPDQPCESGCENSDTEEADHDQPDSGQTHRRYNESRRVRMRVPDYDLDGPLDGPLEGPADGPFTRRGATASERSARARNGPVDRQRRRQVMGDPFSHENMAQAHLYEPRYGWIGHLSVGTSDDEQGTEHRSPNRESSATSANNATPGEEEWAGMQRIVRSLARREDIPDEWWAEAGLIRTLPPDGTD